MMASDLTETLIADLDVKIASLEARHGTGVRPSWVSAEIGDLWGRRQRLQATLDALRGASNDA